MDEDIRVYQDKAKAIKIIKDVSRWLRESGKEVSEWWDADKIDEHFFDKYAKDTDFYVLDIDGIPAATVILQEQQNLQDWSEVDGVSKPTALYVHYLSVDRKFAGSGASYMLLDVAKREAKSRGLSRIRLDTNADYSRRL